MDYMLHIYYILHTHSIYTHLHTYVAYTSDICTHFYINCNFLLYKLYCMHSIYAVYFYFKIYIRKL